MYTHSNPIPQRTHKKSTNGCRACKIRKVKCDEKRPVCSKCTIHYVNINSCEWGHTIKPSKKPQHLPKGRRPAPIHIATPISSIEEKPIRSSSSPLQPPVVLSAKESEKTFAITRLQSQVSLPNAEQCGCPCHIPQYTSMLLDAVFGSCRICGSLPSSDHPLASCTPIIPSGSHFEPFHVLPVESSTEVIKLIHHWHHTLALVPTTIGTEYCTNPTWISASISNSPLFAVTLYVCSAHIDGLHGQFSSPQSLAHKARAIAVLNVALRDPVLATADETISAVLLLGNVLSIIGEPGEVRAHLDGLSRMVALRGGITALFIDGVFLHMLCTMNHLSAVFSETPALHPPTGIAYAQTLYSSTRTPPPHIPHLPQPQPQSPDLTSPMAILPLSTLSQPLSVTTSPFLKPFAIDVRFDATVVDVFHDLGFLYTVLDAFTSRFLPMFRGPFEALVVKIGSGSGGEARDGDMMVYDMQHFGTCTDD